MTTMKRIAIAAVLALAAIGAHAQSELSAANADAVQRRISPNIVWAGDDQGNPAITRVRCAADGTLLNATLVRPSGNPPWDDAALRAVNRSEPYLPGLGDFEIAIRPDRSVVSMALERSHQLHEEKKQAAAAAGPDPQAARARLADAMANLHKAELQACAGSTYPDACAKTVDDNIMGH